MARVARGAAKWTVQSGRRVCTVNAIAAKEQRKPGGQASPDKRSLWRCGLVARGGQGSKGGVVGRVLRDGQRLTLPSAAQHGARAG